MAHLDILARQKKIDEQAAAMVASAGLCRAAIESGGTRFNAAIKSSRKKVDGQPNEAALRTAYSVAKRQLAKANEFLEEAAVALLDSAALVMRTGQECDQAQSVIVASCIRFANRQAVSGDSMHAPLPAVSSGKRRGPEPARTSQSKAIGAASDTPVQAATPVGVNSPRTTEPADAAKSAGRKRATPGAKPGAKRTRRSKKDIQAALEESAAAKSKVAESGMA